MKKAMSKHHDVVVSFLKVNPNSTFDTIKEGNPKISDILLRKVVKDLQEEGMIASNDEDGGYVLTGGGLDTQPKTDTKENTQPLSTVGVKAVAAAEKKKNEVDEELGPKTISGRDFSKYSFNGISGLSKGKVVLAICKQYVKDNPKTTLAKIQEVFQSKEIQPRYNVILEINLARKTTVNKTERYFFKEADIIKIGTQKAVVTNQWSLATLTPLLKIAKGLGYKVTVSK